MTRKYRATARRFTAKIKATPNKDKGVLTNQSTYDLMIIKEYQVDRGNAIDETTS